MADIRNMFSSDTKWPELNWVVVDELKAYRPSSRPASLPPIAPAARDDVCFLQYTSGSTSEPKGVMITHDNLCHNLSTIIHELRAAQDTVVVSWLPQYHDMGLIGSYLGIIYCGGWEQTCRNDDVTPLTPLT